MFLRQARTGFTTIMMNLQKARSDQNTDPRARRKLEELIIITRNSATMLDKIMITAIPRKTDKQIGEEEREEERIKKDRWGTRYQLT